MNQEIRSQIEGDLKKSLTGMGISWSRLEMLSAAKEIALLDQIEINHPSKEVKQTIVVEYPNPNKIGEFIRSEVEHTSRVVMTDEEVMEHHKKQDEERALALYQNDPDRFYALLAKVQKEQAKAAKKPAARKPKKQK